MLHKDNEEIERKLNILIVVNESAYELEQYYQSCERERMLNDNE